MLAPRDLALRLVERGLLAPETLMHGGLVIADASHRNENATITSRGRPILFVKQPTDRGRTIEHEARVYRLLHRDAKLSRFAPSLRHHEGGLLVLAAIRGETLAARAARTGRLSQAVAADLGRAVALLHESRAPLPRPFQRPWILSLGAPPIEILASASAADLQILRIVQESREICRGLDDLRGEWHETTPLHNDLRLENCLVERQNGRTLRIVDWELAGMGDAAWDVGSGIAATVALWLFSLRPLPGMTMAQLDRTASIPLARVRPAAKALWDSYLAARRLPLRARRDLRARSLRFAAARIVQLCWERALNARRPGGEIICALQTAANIIRDPDAAASVLLGCKRTSRE